MVKLSWLLIVIVAGMLIPVQAGFNATFKKITSHAVLAGCWNTLLATLIFMAALLLFRSPFPSVAILSQVPWWAYLGGVCGATYVLVSLVFAPKLGAVLLIVCLAAGQMIASVVIDHFGWVGYDIKPFTLTKLAGIFMIVVGVSLIQHSK